MRGTTYDVLTIGNAIVDMLAHAEDDFLVENQLVKGSMRLIDEAEAERLSAAMADAERVSGGCAGNTAAGVASLGGRAAFFGKVADDALGRFYRDDMAAAGVRFDTAPNAAGGPATARSMILVTPDGERTMNTFLGACQDLGEDDIDRATVEAAAITYLEGYLWDRPSAKDAFRRASAIAHMGGRRVALTLSDSFCVDRYRDEFLQLLRSGAVDVLFMNEHEAKALLQTSDFATAIGLIEGLVPLAVATLGPKGALVVEGGRRTEVPAPPVEQIIDKTGAGDLFAAGFLFGLARGLGHETSAALGCLAAGEVIGHVGARPRTSLAELARATVLPGTRRAVNA